MVIYDDTYPDDTYYNPVVTIGETTVCQATKAEIEIEHDIQEHDTFDGLLLSCKYMPGGSISLTKLTKHDDTTEANFLAALNNLVPEPGTSLTGGEKNRTVTIKDDRGGGEYHINMQNVLIDKYSVNYDGAEVPEFDVDLKAEQIRIGTKGETRHKIGEALNNAASTVSPLYGLSQQ